MTGPVTMIVPFPRRGPSAHQRQLAVRPLPAKPVLALVDNGKAKADVLLEALGSALLARGAIARYTVHRKAGMVPVDDAERAALLDGVDAVVAGVGDCGGCTACSVTDALRCLELGVPAAALITDAFSHLADATEAAYGLAGLHRLTVEHPVWTRDDSWFPARGAELADTWAAAHASGAAPEPTPGAAAVSANPPALDPDTVSGSLAMLRSTLESDGYALRVEVGAGAVMLRVRAASPDACPECLVPAALFGDIAHGALTTAGLPLTRDQIMVEMPVAR
jgi:hypothetical protein